MVSGKYFPPIIPLWYFSFILSHFQFPLYKGQTALMGGLRVHRDAMSTSEAKCLYVFGYRKVI